MNLGVWQSPIVDPFHEAPQPRTRACHRWHFEDSRNSSWLQTCNTCNLGLFQNVGKLESRMVNHGWSHVINILKKWSWHLRATLCRQHWSSIFCCRRNPAQILQRQSDAASLSPDNELKQFLDVSGRAELRNFNQYQCSCRSHFFMTLAGTRSSPVHLISRCGKDSIRDS